MYYIYTCIIYLYYMIVDYVVYINVLMSLGGR